MTVLSVADERPGQGWSSGSEDDTDSGDSESTCQYHIYYLMTHDHPGLAMFVHGIYQGPHLLTWVPYLHI